MAKLFLIPTSLAKPIAQHGVLDYQLPLIQHLQFFIVETAKIGRQHIKQLHLTHALATLSIQELNKLNQNISELMSPLLNGHDIGLLSDCGIPAIADPGSKIITLAHQHKIEVVPLIGPCSIILALMSSGCNGQLFTFNGYLPINKNEQLAKIKQLEHLILQNKHSQIIIETPFRNQTLFECLIKSLSDSIILSLSINLMCVNQRIMTYSIKQWREQSAPDLHKQQVVFVLGMAN